MRNIPKIGWHLTARAFFVAMGVSFCAALVGILSVGGHAASLSAILFLKHIGFVF